MAKKLHISLILILLCAGAFAGKQTFIKGVVRSGQGALSGVVVTNGDNFAVTDHRGRYKLTNEGNARFVYISTPRGYSTPCKLGINQFYQTIIPDKKSYDFVLERKATDDTNHGFITIADPQIWHKKEFTLLKAAMDDIRQSVAEHKDRPFHGVGCGDIVSSDHSLYLKYNEVVARSGISFFNCMGNHDMTNFGRSFESSKQKFEDMFGPAYYSYNVGKVHYVVLNNNFYIGRDWFYIGYLEERQMAWLEHDLGYIKAGSTVVLYMHIPSSCKEEDRKNFSYQNAERTMSNHLGLYKILEPYNTHIISGHTHTMYNQQLASNLYEHVTAAICGAWWQGELCTDGTPRGYGVYEVNADSIRWYYKSTSLPKQHQMRLYSGKDCPEFKDYIVANIWNSDPSWRVELYQDGVRKCEMERFETYDPAAKQMYSSTDKLDHKWISPSLSGHFYRAKLSPTAHKIEVVVTDRFSNTYREELK